LAASGAMERAAERTREGIEHKLDRLRRKGWSRSRIDRWLVQVEADQDRHAQAKAEVVANGAREWCEWLRHALEDVRVEHVGLRRRIIRARCPRDASVPSLVSKSQEERRGVP